VYSSVCLVLATCCNVLNFGGTFAKIHAFLKQKNGFYGFCNAKFLNLGASRSGWKNFVETPRRHILSWFHAFWTLIHANHGFFSRQAHKRKGTLQKVTERLHFTYWREFPTQPNLTKIGMWVGVPNIISVTKFDNDLYNDYEVMEGRILHRNGLSPKTLARLCYMWSTFLADVWWIILPVTELLVFRSCPFCLMFILLGCCNRSIGHHDDDFIFEDFARLRLTGHAADDTEAWHVAAARFFVADNCYVGVQPVCARIFRHIDPGHCGRCCVSSVISVFMIVLYRVSQPTRQTSDVLAGG